MVTPFQSAVKQSAGRLAIASAQRIHHNPAGYTLVDPSNRSPHCPDTLTLSQSLLPIPPEGNGNGKHAP